MQAPLLMQTSSPVWQLFWCVLFAIVGFWISFYSWKHQVALGRTGAMPRAESPLLFWFMLLLWLAVAMLNVWILIGYFRSGQMPPPPRHTGNFQVRREIVFNRQLL